MSNSDEIIESKGDRSLRFLFDNTDIRGQSVHLDKSFQKILAIHQYAPGVSQLMGELLVAAVLLSTTLKFEGKLVLQIRSDGQIPLIMVECTSDQDIRAIARGAEQATSDNFDLLLTDGQLAITIDPDQGERYQGIVPLSGGSVARSLDAYFEQSEQLQTRLWLAADGTHAAGFLLQQLPTQIVTELSEREEQWNHACTLAETVKESELLLLNAEQILHRLYHEESLRVFTPAAVQFRCSCSRDRTYSALCVFDGAELRDILDEQGSISMDCEFCNQQYIFMEEDLMSLLPADKGRTLH
jgi:molecular chaperone Hsp33